MTVVNYDFLVEKIYIIRGKKVILDFELAKIYGYETKNFNRHIKEEISDLRCKNFTSSWGGNRYLPYAFTE